MNPNLAAVVQPLERLLLHLDTFHHRLLERSRASSRVPRGPSSRAVNTAHERIWSV
jgi:hypothetical protein